MYGSTIQVWKTWTETLKLLPHFQEETSSLSTYTIESLIQALKYWSNGTSVDVFYINSTDSTNNQGTCVCIYTPGLINQLNGDNHRVTVSSKECTSKNSPQIWTYLTTYGNYGCTAGFFCIHRTWEETELEVGAAFGRTWSWNSPVLQAHAAILRTTTSVLCKFFSQAAN